MHHTLVTLLGIVLGGGLLACGNGSEADDLGIGAQCAAAEDCDVDTDQVCLSFKGGYCGLMGCTSDLDCVEDSACVAHTDGTNYCFRTCSDKPQCNANRDVENESNCSASVDFVDGAKSRKACVPPS
ncbi:MAG: hypothetical protein M3680_06750 [Myxococcota bacterium]|nr:hypothetical protein [Myxococcota bacterium]